MASCGVFLEWAIESGSGGQSLVIPVAGLRHQRDKLRDVLDVELGDEEIEDALLRRGLFDKALLRPCAGLLMFSGSLGLPFTLALGELLFDARRPGALSSFTDFSANSVLIDGFAGFEISDHLGNAGLGRRLRRE